MDCPKPSSRSFAREQIATDGTVKTLTAATYDATGDAACRQCKAQDAQIQVQGNAIFYTLNGSTPSAAAGKIGYVGSLICLSGYAQIKAFKFTQESAAGEIDVDYFR